MDMFASSPTLRVRGGGNSNPTIKFTEDTAENGSFVRYDGLNNHLVLGTIAAGVETSAINVLRGTSRVGIGLGTVAPLSGLDLVGGLAVGSYAGTVAAPSNGAIISGAVGIMTSAPSSGAALDLGSATGAAFSSLILPRDTTANRPTSPVTGMIRYNTTLNSLEGYIGGSATGWGQLQLSTGSFAGTTILGSSAATTSPSRSGDLTTGLFSSTATSVSVAITGSERLTVTSSGVGVNTSTPAATLDINGYARLKMNTSQPVACAVGTRGSLALTTSGRACVCASNDVWSDMVSGKACNWAG
jgi:hypothetical protein